MNWVLMLLKKFTWKVPLVLFVLLFGCYYYSLKEGYSEAVRRNTELEAQVERLNKDIQKVKEDYTKALYKYNKVSHLLSEYEREALKQRSELAEWQRKFYELANDNPKKAAEDLVVDWNTHTKNLTCITGGEECVN